MTSATLPLITLSLSAYIGIGFAVVASVFILMLCARGKKQDSVTMIRYVKNDELDVVASQRHGSSTNNGRIRYAEENEKRASQHSLPNEGRDLPIIPATNSVNDAISTPGLSSRNDSSSVESSHRNSRSSPKKSTTRRLPALPPDKLEVKQDTNVLPQKDEDTTYEDMRDDGQAAEGALTETVGSGDSSLYAKVPEDLSKRANNDDTDLYAQVGSVEAGDSQQPGTSGTNASPRKESSSSDDDPTMDSPTAVTYASVDKMKKTMSVKKRTRENSASSSSVSAAPPVPERNFDEDELLDAPQDPSEELPPPPSEILQDSSAVVDARVEESATNQQPSQQNGPAYETLSVRESLAHQRLRQMVEDEQRNRYVNTSQRPDGIDLYSQINEDNSEALYESVSVPGSADGTVGVTGQSIRASATNGTRQPGREDGYSTIGAARHGMTDSSTIPQEGSSNSADFPPPPDSSNSVNPNYENIDM